MKLMAARRRTIGPLLSSPSRSIFNIGNQIKQWVTAEGKESPNIAERPLPKANADVCLKHPKEYYEYENSEVIFGFQDDYEFSAKLGRGRYSEVYKGVNLLNNESCVIKILKPGKESFFFLCSLVKRAKIKREIQVLEVLNGHPFIVSLFDYVVDPSTKTPAIVRLSERMIHTLGNGIREEH